MLRQLPQRYLLVCLSMLAVFICYIDRVNMSEAINTASIDRQTSK